MFKLDYPGREAQPISPSSIFKVGFCLYVLIYASFHLRASRKTGIWYEGLDATFKTLRLTPTTAHTVEFPTSKHFSRLKPNYAQYCLIALFLVATWPVPACPACDSKLPKHMGQTGFFHNAPGTLKNPWS